MIQITESDVSIESLRLLFTQLTTEVRDEFLFHSNIESPDMALELYQEVSLTRDLPDHNLKTGDIATLIDVVPHPSEGEEGCVLEVFNAIGESIAVIAVPVSAVEVLRSDEILTVRSLTEAS